MKKSLRGEESPRQTTPFPSYNSPVSLRRTQNRATSPDLRELLFDRLSPRQRTKASRFLNSIKSLLKDWLHGTDPSTQRMYSHALESFTKFVGIPWPGKAQHLFTVMVQEADAWQISLKDEGYSPSTVLCRRSAVNSLYRFLASCATKKRLAPKLTDRVFPMLLLHKAWRVR